MRALTPPHLAARSVQDVRNRFKFPEEFPEGAYGSPDRGPVGTANGRWHVGQRSLSSEADPFAFETYRYDLGDALGVGARADGPRKGRAGEPDPDAGPNGGDADGPQGPQGG